MSENLKPFLMTSQQVTAVLMKFGELLEVFAQQLPGDRHKLAELVKDAAVSIRELAADVGKGDQDVAAEIVRSTARLVGAIRGVVHGSSARSTVH